MAAFILAIGILGLAMLQMMVIRYNGGSRASTTAIKIGEQVAEQIQTEGRQRLLFVRNGQALATSSYFATNTTVYQYFDGTGAKQNITSADANTIYTVAILKSDICTAVATVGGVKAFQITVAFSDVVDPKDSSKVIRKTLSFTRQVAYANA